MSSYFFKTGRQKRERRKAKMKLLQRLKTMNPQHWIRKEKPNKIGAVFGLFSVQNSRIFSVNRFCFGGNVP